MTLITSILLLVLTFSLRLPKLKIIVKIFFLYFIIPPSTIYICLYWFYNMLHKCGGSTFFWRTTFLLSFFINPTDSALKNIVFFIDFDGNCYLSSEIEVFSHEVSQKRYFEGTADSRHVGTRREGTTFILRAPSDGFWWNFVRRLGGLAQQYVC